MFHILHNYNVRTWRLFMLHSVTILIRLPDGLIKNFELCKTVDGSNWAETFDRYNYVSDVMWNMLFENIIALITAY